MPWRSAKSHSPLANPPRPKVIHLLVFRSVAEYFRDKGQHVLLLMDSLRRYAMAQREIALAIGEPPATKGYPPSCFPIGGRLFSRQGATRVAADGFAHALCHGAARNRTRHWRTPRDQRLSTFLFSDRWPIIFATRGNTCCC